MALLRLLNDAYGAARERWIESYKAISNGIDAALFMTEARLRLQHGINVDRLGDSAATRGEKIGGVLLAATRRHEE